ncbi:MAG: hypothetical protein IKD74_07500 [Clostridia bacterium]|nr:hypothetical protein [Clostridia bacterium]MBR6136526.1 hypothetical protein [Bacilli bacterium]
MAGGNITIDFGQAMADAQEIEKIINNIDGAINTLNAAFNVTDDETKLDWYDKMSAEWKEFADKDIPTTLAEMRKSKTNIENAVATMQQYQQ